MAGMEDYEFYAQLQRDSPFWQRRPGGDAPPRDTPEQSFQAASFQEEQDAHTQKVAGLAVGLVGLLTENLLVHPFVVLRRQCQVNVNSHRYHLLPFTLMPVVVRLSGRQGFTTLWKGIGSVLVVRGLTLAVEDLVSKLTPWPKEITRHSSFKMIGMHLLLKCVSLAVVTPFYSASLVETVQSEIASERPGIFDIFKEGICRMVSWSPPQTGRLLPVWVLVVPTVAHGLLQYILSTLVKGATFLVWKNSQREEQRRRGAIPREDSSQIGYQCDEMMAGLVGQCVGDIILFPLETILHRLHLQGTRTIIDNLDSGQEVVPILTNYQGASDCLNSTLTSEGIHGLFKGCGALILQYAVQVAIFKAIHFVVVEVGAILRPPVPPASSLQPQQLRSAVLTHPPNRCGVREVGRGKMVSGEESGRIPPMSGINE